ncbi:MAG: hypothetical protein PVI21_02790 [Candidatus Woesebacteria bacterium]|jgi:hypothetical protein
MITKMSGVIKSILGKLKPKRGIVFAAFLLTLGFITLVASNTIKPVAAAEKTPCLAQGYSLGYKSTYSGACLGEEANLSFVEFVVTFSQPVSNAEITISNAQGQLLSGFPSTFAKSNDTLYYSQKDSRGLGYQVSGTAVTCNTSDNYSQVTITVKVNGQQQNIDVNACSEVKSGNWTVTKASSLTGNAQSGQGRIVGTFTTIRPNAPVGDTRRTGTAEKEGVISITLTGPSGKTGNNTSDWYTLKDGQLTIPNLEPGTYGLSINYNDRATATEDNIIAEWADPNITVSQSDIVVNANQDTAITLSNESTANDATSDSETATCSAGEGLAGALSWILCPITELIINSTEFIQNNLITPYLTVSPLSQDSNNAIYKLWESIRNIANILFIVAFFIIIFSQATSIGLSNYGIKKLLPRLILVAIGTNLSYYIVAFIIDAFNVFGAGVAQLVMGVIDSSGVCAGQVGGSSGDFWAFLVIGLGAAVTGTGGAAISLILSLLGTVFIIVLVAVVTLILRQMLILLLVIVAPLAFVAWLLPNTEQYFSKWRELLIKLLMMYPMIVLLFALGKIIAALINCGDLQLSTGESGSDTVASAVKMGTVTFASALPLVLIPATFMAGGALISKAANSLRRGGENLKQSTTKAYENSGFGRFRANRKAERDREIAAGNYSGSRILHPGARAKSWVNRGLNTSRPFNAITGGYGSNRALDIDRQKREEQDSFKKMLNGDYEIAEAWIQSGGKTNTTQFDKLNDAQKQVYRQMVLDRRDRSADSFIAAQQLVADSGRGNKQMLLQAYDKVRELSPGTANKDIQSLAEYSRSTWRSKGRGDLVVQAGGTRREDSFAATETNASGQTKYGWSEVAPQNYSRHPFTIGDGAGEFVRYANANEEADLYFNPDGTPVMDTSDPDPANHTQRRAISSGEASLRAYITDPRTGRENLRTVISGLDDIQDVRAKEKIIRSIRNELADQARPAPMGTPAGTPTRYYTRDNIIQELRDEFKLNRGA